MLVLRKRTSGHRSFLEFFLIGKPLSLPKSLPSRFNGRVVSEFEMNSIKCVLTDSSAPAGVIKYSSDTIVSNGVWAHYQDTIPRGAYADEKIDPVSVFFGVPIDKSLFALLCFEMAKIYVKLGLNPLDDPHVVYHGTSRENVKLIIRDSFKPTMGMLGLAIYFGTFFKAFRFATRTQTYEIRPGAIMRVYAFWTTPTIKHYINSQPCVCSECVKKPESPSRRIADHDAIWSKITDFVFVVAGGPIKNDEYACIDTSKLLIEGVGHAETLTEHHEPLKRDLCII